MEYINYIYPCDLDCMGECPKRRRGIPADCKTCEPHTFIECDDEEEEEE